MKRILSLPFIVAAAVSILLAGCASITSRFGEADERWADYRSWSTVSDTPSTGASLGLGEVHKGPSGYRMVYVNEAGRETITGEGPYDYPVGTVLVKEQYDDRAAYESGKGADITVSLKVNDAAEKPVDNWAWAAGYKADAGENAFCSGCHSIPFAKDFVFSNVAYLAENEGK